MAELQTTATIYADGPESSVVPPVTQAVYNRDLLTRAFPYLVHDKFGQRNSLKRANGINMVFRRYEKLGLATSPLTEGVTPTGTTLDKTDVVATVQQYGNWIGISDLLKVAGVDNTIRETASLLGENMGETLDVVWREVLNAGTQYICVDIDDSGAFTTSQTRSDTNGRICKSALDAAILALDTQNARRFTQMVAGQDKDATFPLAPAYWAIIHPAVTALLYSGDTSVDLAVGSEFTPVERYSSYQDVMPNEVGKYRNIRFVETTQAKVFAGEGESSSDVYSTLIFGKDAYGIVPLEGMSSRTIIHRGGSTTDPLNQRNTVAWKAATCAIILNDNFMYRIESQLAAGAA
jgi:N4-gp56 family major capsid protein